MASGNSEKTAQILYKKGQEEDAIRQYLPMAWNKMIEDADENLIDLVAGATERVSGSRPPNERVGRFIAEHRTSLLLEEPRGEMRPSRTTKPGPQSKYQPTGYTGKQVSSFTLDGKTYSVNTWRDMLLKVCELTLQHNPRSSQELQSLRGKKRFYFSPKPTSLVAPAKVPGSSLYVETNLSANSIVKLCRNVLSVAGSSEDLRIATSG